jgi:hypothetical protein
MKIIKPKVIKFAHAKENSWMNLPKPAKNYVPEWFKKMPRQTGGVLDLDENGNANNTMKACIPTLDAFAAGYIVELWQDIQVKKVLDERGRPSVRFFWGSKPQVLDVTSVAGVEQLPIPAGHLDTHFIWKSVVSIETPPGYSCLVTHPMNRFDLPFTTMSGIADTDKHPLGAGNMPFFLKEDFEGFIPKGTPLFQVFPFKRDNWVSQEDPATYDKAITASKKARSMATGYYRKYVWVKKKYE